MYRISTDAVLTHDGSKSIWLATPLLRKMADPNVLCPNIARFPERRVWCRADSERRTRYGRYLIALHVCLVAIPQPILSCGRTRTTYGACAYRLTLNTAAAGANCKNSSLLCMRRLEVTTRRCELVVLVGKFSSVQRGYCVLPRKNPTFPPPSSLNCLSCARETKIIRQYSRGVL